MLIDTDVLIWYMRGNEKAKHLIRNANGFSIKNSAHNQCIGLCTDEICNYFKDLKESDDTFKRLKLTPVTIRFDLLFLKKIKMLANKSGISYNAYIRYLLAKSIEVEMIHKSLR